MVDYGDIDMERRVGGVASVSLEGLMTGLMIRCTSMLEYAKLLCASGHDQFTNTKFPRPNTQIPKPSNHPSFTLHIAEDRSSSGTRAD